ncbi:hypothetical protein ACTNDY_00720 [Tissierellaceae bacterium HCP3S3_D8]
MVWIYISILLLILIFSIIYRLRDIKAIRVFGLELIGLLFSMFFLMAIVGEIFLPMPQYYIKHGRNKVIEGRDTVEEITLNEILEEEILKSGIEFDDKSLKILDSHGMHFNHLFLCSYKIEGEEEVRIFHFKKNIFGNMKPKYPLNQAYIISKENNGYDFYHSYVKDGIFAGYLVTAGFGSSSSKLINYKLNKYVMEKIEPDGYFMWIEMVKEPWKSMLVKWILYAALIFIVNRFQNEKREPVRFYSRWRRGDRIFYCIKNE